MLNGDDWGTPPSGAAEGGALIGQTLYDLEGRPLGRLTQSGGGALYLVTGSGTTQKWNPFRSGTYLIDVGLGKARSVGIDAAGNMVFTSTGELGGGDGTGAAPSYMSTQPAQAAQFAHEQAMTNLQAQLQAAESARDFERSAQLQREILAEQQKFQAEQNRLAEEAMLKRERLDVLQGLVQGFLESQQRASEFVLQLQGDPFRFAAAAQGMPVMGTTPQQGYAQALTEFAQRPAPTLDPNAPLSAIEGGIESIMGQQFPLQPGMFGGMGAGGTVPMGASGTFLVGEAGPEVMEVSPRGVTVKPLSGGFQYGGGVDFDINTILQGLAPLFSQFRDLFPTVPRAVQRPGGIWAGHEAGPRAFTRPGALEALGIRPSLMQIEGRPTVYYRDPTTDSYRGIASSDIFKESGFQWSDIVHFDPTTRGQFQFGDPLTSPLTPQTPEQMGPFGPLSSMAIEPTSGGILPAPYKIAAMMRRMASVNPQLRDILTSAYNYPGSPIMPGALKTAEDIFTPRGSYQAPLGLR